MIGEPEGRGQLETLGMHGDYPDQTDTCNKTVEMMERSTDKFLELVNRS
jgi:hypothetical protein